MYKTKQKRDTPASKTGSPETFRNSPFCSTILSGGNKTKIIEEIISWSKKMLFSFLIFFLKLF